VCYEGDSKPGKILSGIGVEILALWRLFIMVSFVDSKKNTGKEKSL